MVFTTAFLFGALVVSESPAASDVQTPNQASVANSSRSSQELRKAIYDGLKRSAAASDPDPYVIAPELIGLFEELRNEKQIEEFDHRRLRGLLRTRLEALARQIEKGFTEAAKPQSVATRCDVLAQQGLPAAGGGGAARGGRGAIIGGSQGGLPDNGPALVDLIKRTIAPNTWDDVGGPGSIYYYRPLRVLVVRQTGEVHEQLGGVLGGLRGK